MARLPARSIIAIVLIALAAMAAAGVFLPLVYKAREKAELERCKNNLREIGLFGLTHSALPNEPVPATANTYFPSGTIVNHDLAFDRRLSWYPTIIAAVDQGPVEPGQKLNKHLHYTELLAQIDLTKAWDDAGANARAGHERLIFAICPAQNSDFGGGPALTNYLGNGGLGPNTAALSLEAAGTKAGVFRYDEVTPLEVIRNGDGLSNTISVAETAFEIGPWLRGGPATVRSLGPDQPPYLGPGRLYSGCHPGVGNFAMADGAVRTLTDSMSPAVFRALLTIRGNEQEFDDP
jgi:prepilin-type processing-associated H-X9-DG protein